MTEGCNSWLILFESFARSRGRAVALSRSQFLRFKIFNPFGFGVLDACYFVHGGREKKSSHRSSEFLNRQLD